MFNKKRALGVVALLMACSATMFAGCDQLSGITDKVGSLVGGIIGGQEQEAGVNVALDKESVAMIVGDEITLAATVEGSEEAPVWTTSDAAVATVEDGKVTAIGIGSATITVTVGGKMATCEITVAEKIPAGTLTLNETEISLEMGTDFYIVPTIEKDGEEIYGDSYAYTSADATIATVDETGKITGIAPGATTVKVAVTIGSEEIVAEMIVNVIASVELTTNMTKVELTILDLNDNDAISQQLDVALEIAGVDSELPLAYASSDENVFVVSENGLVESVGVGEGIVTVTAEYEGETMVVELPVTVIRTTQETFEVSVVGKSSASVLNKAVEGYETAHTYEISVTPYAPGVEIEWSVGGTMLTLAQDAEDPRKATVTAIENTLGNKFNVTATVEGLAEATATMDCTVYNPITCEADLWALNSKTVDKSTVTPSVGSGWNPDTLNYSTDAIAGWYILTNDIVLQNNDPANSGVTDGGVSYYKTAIIGHTTAWNKLSSTFVGLFDGNGYTISNMKFAINVNFCALFGSNAGIIRNLGVELTTYEWTEAFPTTSVRRMCAAIVAYNTGIISNCRVKTDLNVDNDGNHPAAIALSNGYWASRIDNCFVEVNANKAYAAAANNYVCAITRQHENGNIKNCWALKTGLVSQIKDFNSIGTYGKTENVGSGTTLAELKEKGFDAEAYNADIWTFTESEGALTVALKNGCSMQKVNA